jgi:hypothetical protein
MIITIIIVMKLTTIFEVFIAVNIMISHVECDAV